jgi:hypothetical protein
MPLLKKAYAVKKVAPVKTAPMKKIAAKPLSKTPVEITADVPKKKKPSASTQQCASVRSASETQFQCLMMAKENEKYCSIHLHQPKITDYMLVSDDIMEMDELMAPMPTISNTNLIVKKISLEEDILKKPTVAAKKAPLPVKKNKVLDEQKISTVVNSHKENEDDLEIKLLILVNDDEYSEQIKKLIGPVFDDITLSEDEQDPITMDPIWKLDSTGKKIPSNVNKYYLFSYKDSKGKIRCVTIFTIYDMIQNEDYVHPITTEKIPSRDIRRAKKLIDLYNTKIGLFNEDESNLSPEFKLKNRITRLFKKFHIHSIYLEESWLLDISDIGDLYKIIKETEKLVSNNIKTINPNLHGFKVFQRKRMAFKGPKGSSSGETPLELHEYIVEEWERLIEAADSPQNQIPIWIIASGLSFVVPAVKEKFPDLEVMM